MDKVLSQRIELARALARRRGHLEVEPTHLLAAVVDATDVTKALREKGLDPDELRERVTAHLSGAPSLGGYRDRADRTDTPLSASVARVVQRLTARRWLLLGARITVVDALLPEPSIAALVFELRRGNDCRHILERATAAATMSAHASTGIEHLFRALLDIRSFVDTLTRAEGDPDRLRNALDTALATHAPNHTPGRVPPPFAPALRRIVASTQAQARLAQAPAASIRQLCLELARQDEAAPYWNAAGIAHADFVRAVMLPGQRALGGRPSE